MERKIIFTKKPEKKKKEYKYSSVPIRIGVDRHQKIREIAEFSGKALYVVCNELLDFALAHLHLEEDADL